MSAANLLKGCPLFYEIYDAEVEKIVQDCLVASYGPGDTIIKQGDDSSDICILLSGSAKVIVSKDDVTHHITTLGVGDIFGELVLINETKRTASIVADSPSDVLVMGHETFYHQFNKNPKVFALMVLNITRLITKRLKAANNIIETLKGI